MTEAEQLIIELGLDRAEERRINDALASSGEGLAVCEGVLVDADAVGKALNVLNIGTDATSLLTGKFAPVIEQYQRALNALDARPIQDEKAISEAVGAVEAVVRLVTVGGKDFRRNVMILFEEQQTWTKLLGKILGQLQGYRSQVPGAGHGRYTESNVTAAEARFVVRACGAAITWLIDDAREGRW